MSRQYTAIPQYIQGPKRLGPRIRVKFNSKITITNHRIEILYYMYYKLYYCRSRMAEKIKEMRAEEMSKREESFVMAGKSF